MKKYERIKKATDFSFIINKGKYIKNKYYSIYYIPSEYKFPRFGLAVSKKCGNAVNRNKLKRQLRMLIDENKKAFSNNKNYIIMIRKEINDLSFPERKKYFVNLLIERKTK